MKNIRFPKLGFNFRTLLYLLAVVGVLLFPNPMLAMVPLGAGMILDAQLLFSDAQALTVTAVSTNIIDLSSDRDIGFGEPLAILVSVDVAAAGGGTLTIAVQADDNTGFSSAGTVAITAALAAAALTAGARVVIPIPPDTLTERYMRLNYTLATMTGITVTSVLMPLKMISVSERQFYPDAINIG